MGSIQGIHWDVVWCDLIEAYYLTWDKIGEEKVYHLYYKVGQNAPPSALVLLFEDGTQCWGLSGQKIPCTPPLGTQKVKFFDVSIDSKKFLAEAVIHI